ncbi:MAG: carbohydrate-binding family 9-like protein [Myxococcota bacterium]|jgi:hypothetical protein|nr:carbohydrate-binding family 9-like protein [Myxococcota bacterium]
MSITQRVPRSKRSLADFWRHGDASWLSAAASFTLEQVRPEGSSHRPKVRVRALHDEHSLALRFDVSDRWVIARAEKLNDPVCRDACVEAFLRPLPDKGYFNFELNCCGVLHASYVEDWRRTAGGLEKATLFSPRDAELIQRRHSLPAGSCRIEHEAPLEYWVELLVPCQALERFVGPLPALSSQAWTANFYKCADDSSHPHWLSWTPLKQRNFHCPECFGILDFDACETRELESLPPR